VPRKKKTYALLILLMTMFFDIFPRAIKRLSTSPAVTARIVNDMVILAPISRVGTHEIILSTVA
jgi:hypothetical protein